MYIHIFLVICATNGSQSRSPKQVRLCTCFTSRVVTKATVMMLMRARNVVVFMTTTMITIMTTIGASTAKTTNVILPTPATMSIG